MAGGIGTEIDERRVAKLSGGWGVHVSSSILFESDAAAKMVAETRAKPARLSGESTMNRTWKWLAVAGCVVVLGTVAGRVHFARAAEEGSASERAPAGDDAASRLDRIIEKLDRVVDRMNAERMGPPGPPPQRGPGDRGSPGEHGPRGPRGHGEHAGRGLWSEGRPPRPPRPDMPPEMQEMIEKRMHEGRQRMEQARKKFRELEERVKRLEAEVERLKAK